jgi:hypothetical protein
MKTPNTSLKTLDHAGITASVLCAIHCIVLPLLLGGLTAGGLTATGVAWLRNESVEWVFLISSFSIGVFGLLPGYRRVHRHKRCLWLFSIGVLSILAGRLANARSLPDTPFVVGGAALIISAHAANRYLCARCTHCSVEEHSPE